MKSILIAASIVGAAVAGIILYLQNESRENSVAGRVEDAASDAYQTMNEHIGRIERPAQHAMG